MTSVNFCRKDVLRCIVLFLAIKLTILIILLSLQNDNDLVKEKGLGMMPSPGRGLKPPEKTTARKTIFYITGQPEKRCWLKSGNCLI